MGVKRLYTEREIDVIRRMSKNHPAKCIAEVLGRPVKGIHKKMFELGIKGYDIRWQSRISDFQKAWFKKNFPHVANIVCATILGVSTRTVNRMAKALGLQKTRQFMKEAQAHTTKKACASHLRNGTYPQQGVVNDNLKKGEPFRFKKKKL